MAVDCRADPIEDLGAGVTIERRYLDDKFEGLAYWHPTPTGQVCQGYVYFDDDTGWKLRSEQPLTIEPSLLCLACGHHGVITNGRWVEAPYESAEALAQRIAQRTG